MKHTSLLLLSIFLTACGQDGKPSVVDPAFTSYYQGFRDAGTNRGIYTDVPVTIEFGSPSQSCTAPNSYSELMACCHDYTITVDPGHWGTMSGAQRELLIYHELGHCVLYRNHRTDTERGLPESIMYPDTTDGYLPGIYPEFKSQYLDELFGKSDLINFGF